MVNFDDADQHDLLQAAANASYNKGLGAIAGVRNVRAVPRTGRALRFVDEAPAEVSQEFVAESLGALRGRRTGSTLRTRASRAALLATHVERDGLRAVEDGRMWGGLGTMSLSSGSTAGSGAPSRSRSSSQERPGSPASQGMLAQRLGEMFEPLPDEGGGGGSEPSSLLALRVSNLFESAVGEVGGGVASLFASLTPPSNPVSARDGPGSPWAAASPLRPPSDASSFSPIPSLSGEGGRGPRRATPAGSPMGSLDSGAKRALPPHNLPSGPPKPGDKGEIRRLAWGPQRMSPRKPLQRQHEERPDRKNLVAF